MKLIALTLLLLVTLNLAYADSNSNSRVDCENSYLDCDTVKDTLICDMDKTTFVACGMVDCDGSMSNSDYVKCLKNSQSIQENNKNIEEDQIYIEDLQPVFVPQFKSRKSILYQCPSPLSYNQSTQNNQQEDEVIENSEKLSYKISESQISNKYFKQNFFKSKNKNDNSSALEFKKENINLVQESHQISKNIDAEQPINRQNIIKDCQNKFLFESSNLGKVFQSQKQQKEKQNAETIKMILGEREANNTNPINKKSDF
ncbi:hypothetical protein ABPG73_009293 [Tetrahymena malaccensis]